MAVAAGGLVQVLLMILLRRVETGQFAGFHHDGRGVLRLQLAELCADDGFIRRVYPVDTGAVLVADVLALLFKAGGVDDAEENTKTLLDKKSLLCYNTQEKGD